MYDKKNLKGSGHSGSDDAAFLKTDNPNSARGNWDASASGEGYNARWNDDKGYERGTGAYTDSNSGLVQKLPDERVDYAHEGLSPLLDDSQPYDKMLPGGAALTKGKGVGAGKPRYGAKPLAPRTNSRDR